MVRRVCTAIAILTGAIVCSLDASAQTVSIDAIELVQPSYNIPYKGHAISDDGQTVVGEHAQNDTAYRWTNAGVQNLSTLSGFNARERAVAVSADGRMIVGEGTNYLDERRAVLWTDGVVESLGLLPNEPAAKWSAATGISADGSVVVGVAHRQGSSERAFRWTRSGGMKDLGFAPTFPNIGYSAATAVSADGTVVVGRTAGEPGDWHAMRWTSGGMVDIGYLGGFGRSCARGVSADGKIVVGESIVDSADVWEHHAFRWTAETGMVDLGTVESVASTSVARAVSANGRIIVGAAVVDVVAVNEALIWIDGEPRRLWDYLVEVHDFDPSDHGWTRLSEVTDCSADGRFLSGWGTHNATTGQLQSAFRITLPRLNDKPSIESSIAEGAAVQVREGEAFSVSVDAWDADAGDDLTLGVVGLPSGAKLTPIEGTTQAATKQAPFKATLQWTPGASDVGLPHPVTISFTDEMNGVSRLSFTIEVRSNDAPTVAPVTPAKIECIDGKHLVDLATTANDPDGDPLTATWKVDGKIVKTGNVAADGTTAYAGDFEHGMSVVELLVSDGILVTTTSTTVTVEDTLDPTILVTPRIEIATEKGKAFASRSRLTPPKAQDASGHPVTFTNDAPATLALGARVVTWTATDIGGNQVTARQTVIVRDREKPLIGAAPPLQLFCDPGKTYATNRLKKPTVKDNIPGTISLTSSAKSQLPIGTHRVVWTAKDAAGNIARKTQSVTVINRKPRANAGRDIVVTTRSERGANVTLVGTASSDPDRQTLRYKWSASGVALKSSTSARATGRFPVGSRTAKLTVTDTGGLTMTDTVRVIVRLKNGRVRPRGSDANRSFAAASEQASSSSRTSVPSGASLRGLAYANAASGFGDAAGEYVRWEDGQTEADATLAYAELRAVQRTYGQAAANALLSAYAETGDESLLSAYGHAAYGTAYAAADLQDR